MPIDRQGKGWGERSVELNKSRQRENPPLKDGEKKNGGGNGGGNDPRSGIREKVRRILDK